MLSHLCVNRSVDRGPALKRSHMSTSTICPEHRHRRHRSPTRPNQRSKLKNPRWRLKRAKSSSDPSNLGKYGRFLALIVGNRQQICPLFWFY